jgi:hypothetical protein
MNEAAAVTRRRIEGLLDDSGRILATPIKQTFDSVYAIKQAPAR